jgi:hypothetical protein
LFIHNVHFFKDSLNANTKNVGIFSFRKYEENIILKVMEVEDEEWGGRGR